MKIELQERVPINGPDDIVVARQQGRAWAMRMGFASSESTIIATAISELVRNILTYAGHGELRVSTYSNGTDYGLEITAQDSGPGIPDVEMVMQQGFSTARGLGLGLPGVRRVVDEFDIQSHVGRGTTVTVRKSRR